MVLAFNSLINTAKGCTRDVPNIFAAHSGWYIQGTPTLLQP